MFAHINHYSFQRLRSVFYVSPEFQQKYMVLSFGRHMFKSFLKYLRSFRFIRIFTFPHLKYYLRLDVIIDYNIKILVSSCGSIFRSTKSARIVARIFGVVAYFFESILGTTGIQIGFIEMCSKK